MHFLVCTEHSVHAFLQARAEGGAEGAWAPAPLHHNAQSALLSRQFFFYIFFIKHPSVKAFPI